MDPYFQANQNQHDNDQRLIPQYATSFPTDLVNVFLFRICYFLHVHDETTKV